jgi:hypothetical protein
MNSRKILIALSALSLAACSGHEPTSATSTRLSAPTQRLNSETDNSWPCRVYINPTSAQINVGGTYQFTATMQWCPNGTNTVNPYLPTSNANAYWSSSNSNVVNASGSLQSSITASGVAQGSATIEARVYNSFQNSAGYVSAFASVTVDYAPLNVTINGPSVSYTVVSPGLYTYTASGYGGSTGSYTYSWSVTRPDGYVQDLGTGSSKAVPYSCMDNGSNYVQATVYSGGQQTTRGRPQNINIAGSC